MSRYLTFLSIVLVMLAAPAVRAQDGRFVSLDDPVYAHLARLQRHGYLLDLDPTTLPYSHAALRRALSALTPEAVPAPFRRLVIALRRRFVSPSDPAEQTRVGLETGGGATVISGRRDNPLRPLGTAPRFFEHLLLRASMTRGPFFAQLGARHDLYYDRDPDGLDAVNRLVARGEEAYVGAAGRHAALVLGRYANHWGAYGRDATLISDNPRSYDLLSLRLGGRRLSLLSLVGELDSITGDGRYTGIAGDDSVATGSERRFLSAHRITWRPSRNVVLAFMESTLYSGVGTGFSLKYLNPLLPALLSVDNRPKNDENNGFIGGLLWARMNRLAVYGQLMIDDFDVLNGAEPTSFSLTGSLHYAATPVLDVGGTFTAVASRTYNTGQPEGRYLYLLRGLATQFSDYLETSVFLDYYPSSVYGLRLRPQVRYLAQGERDIRDPFPARDEPVQAVLTGTVERTLRAALGLSFQRDEQWWLTADAGINHVRNDRHVSGRTRIRFAGTLTLGFRLRYEQGLGDDF